MARQDDGDHLDPLLDSDSERLPADTLSAGDELDDDLADDVEGRNGNREDEDDLG